MHWLYIVVLKSTLLRSKTVSDPEAFDQKLHQTCSHKIIKRQNLNTVVIQLLFSKLCIGNIPFYAIIQ